MREQYATRSTDVNIDIEYANGDDPPIDRDVGSRRSRSDRLVTSVIVYVCNDVRLILL